VDEQTEEKDDKDKDDDAAEEGWFYLHAGYCGKQDCRRNKCMLSNLTNIMERHVSNTRSMRWEIYYVHPQSGHMLRYTQATAGCRPLQPATVCSGENLRTNIGYIHTL